MKGITTYNQAVLERVERVSEAIKVHVAHPQFHANGFEKTQDKLAALRAEMDELHAGKEYVASLQEQLNAVERQIDVILNNVIQDSGRDRNE